MPRKDRLPTVAEGWVPNRHGIPASYNRGCRCTECRQANAERARRGGHNKRSRDKKLAERVLGEDGRWYAPNPWGGHGTICGYTTSGCRCPECSRAMREYYWPNRSGSRRTRLQLAERDLTVDLGSVFGR